MRAMRDANATRCAGGVTDTGALLCCARTDGLLRFFRARTTRMTRDDANHRSEMFATIKPYAFATKVGLCACFVWGRRARASRALTRRRDVSSRFVDD